MKVQVFSADRSDELREFLRQLLREDYGLENVRLKELDDVQASYFSGNGCFWLGIGEQNQILGCIGLVDQGRGRGYLKRMYIEGSLRGKGLGQKLLNELLEYARGRSFEKIYLATTNYMEGAQRFYERNGFLRIPELPPDIDDFGDDVFFVLPL